MRTARLYCQGACATCRALTQSLNRVNVAITVFDVIADAAALDDVVALGYRSLPVFVSPDGSVAAGDEAVAAVDRLIAQHNAESLSRQPGADDSPPLVRRVPNPLPEASANPPATHEENLSHHESDSAKFGALFDAALRTAPHVSTPRRHSSVPSRSAWSAR